MDPSQTVQTHLGDTYRSIDTWHQQFGSYQISGSWISPYLSSQLMASNHGAALSHSRSQLRVCYKHLWTKKLYLSPIHWCLIEDVSRIMSWSYTCHTCLIIFVRCSFDLWVWLPAHGHGISWHDTTTKRVQDATDSGGMLRNSAIFDLGFLMVFAGVIHIISYHTVPWRCDYHKSCQDVWQKHQMIYNHLPQAQPTPRSISRWTSWRSSDPAARFCEGWNPIHRATATQQSTCLNGLPCTSGPWLWGIHESRAAAKLNIQRFDTKLWPSAKICQGWSLCFCSTDGKIKNGCLLHYYLLPSWNRRFHLWLSLWPLLQLFHCSCLVNIDICVATMPSCDQATESGCSSASFAHAAACSK